MCGRFTLRTPLSTLARQLGLPLSSQAIAYVTTPRYNVAPTQSVAAAWRGEGGSCEITALRWGLAPPWVQTPRASDRRINIRAETLARRSAFQPAFTRRRCLVLADGFYEWRREGRVSRPFLFERADGQPLLLAGIWEPPREGEPAPRLPSCAILTVEANRLVAALHDRMPAILALDQLRPWLAHDAPPETLLAMLVPAPEGVLTVRPVSTRVNSVRNDDPSLLDAE
jgi:putative SOS response-associated peptidase YedK